MKIGDTPQQQMRLEKKRFEARLKRMEQMRAKKKENLIKTDDGKNKKLK